MRLSSDAFLANEPIPARYTCDGDNLSPQLAWEGTPDGTSSLVVICDDPDAPGGAFYHWAAFDIPADCSGLAEGVDRKEAAFNQAINDFQRTGYDGPCPPRTHGAHRYRFRLLALSVKHLAHGRHSCREVDSMAGKHVISEANLVGLYKRR